MQSSIIKNTKNLLNKVWQNSGTNNKNIVIKEKETQNSQHKIETENIKAESTQTKTFWYADTEQISQDFERDSRRYSKNLN